MRSKPPTARRNTHPFLPSAPNRVRNPRRAPESDPGWNRRYSSTAAASAAPAPASADFRRQYPVSAPPFPGTPVLPAYGAGCRNIRETAFRSPSSCPGLAAAARDEYRASPVVPAPALTSPKLSSRPHGFPGGRGPEFHPCRLAASLLAPEFAEIPARGRHAEWAPDGRLPSNGTTLPSPPLRLSVSPAPSASSERDSGRAQS